MQDKDSQGLIRDWRDLMLRMQQITRNDQGVTILEFRVAVERGWPKWWAVLRAVQVEPASAAAAFCEALERME